jgi:hypothetical protein
MISSVFRINLLKDNKLARRLQARNTDKLILVKCKLSVEKWILFIQYRQFFCSS